MPTFGELQRSIVSMVQRANRRYLAIGPQENQKVAPSESAPHHNGRREAPQLGGESDAIDTFRRAFELDPFDAGAGLWWAKWELGKGENSAALAIYRRVLERSPQVAEAHYGCGVAALGLGDRTEAIEAFRRAYELNPRYAEAGLRLAEMELCRGDHLAALGVYRRILDLAHDLAEAHYGCGVAALGLGDRTEAIQAFRRAYELNPRFAAAGLRLAEMELCRGDNLAALGIYRRILELAPDLAEAHYGCGVAALELGRPGEASAGFEQALILKPDYAAAATARGLLAFFPEPRIARKARENRPLVCIPITPFCRDWLGGQIYLLNFARIVSSLPKQRRPRLVIAMLVNEWQQVSSLRQVVEELTKCDAVFGIFEQARRLIYSKQALNRYVRHKASPSGKSTDWTLDLFSRVDWTFPILHPSWGSAAVPGPLFWISDLRHRLLPTDFNAAELMTSDIDFGALSSRPMPIIFSSHDAQAHFRQFYPEQHSRTHVWHFCTVPDPCLVTVATKDYTALKLPQRFYYTPNQFWPHKDHVTLFRSLRRILDAGRDVTFVCTGSVLGSDAGADSSHLLELIEKLRLGQNLRLLGVLPRPIQLEVMRRACAIIQPSLHEGWSTVVEDAQAFGRPLIVSDLPVHHEQAGEDALFFRAGDSAALAAAVTGVDDRLSPGPDRRLEAAAHAKQLRRVQSSASQFMNILATEMKFRS